MKALLLLLLSSVAHANPISLPWNLRPVGPVNVVRVDTVASETFVSTATFSYKVVPRVATLVRGAVTERAISNPVIGVMAAPPRASGRWKLGTFAAVALPLGTNDPAAQKAAALARSSMDNAMFAINDVTPIVGVDVAYVRGGATLQAEATLFELIHVRREQPDAYKTNFTTGLHAGYFVRPWLCASAEVRYQRFLSAMSLSSHASVAVGARVLWKVAGSTLAPGVSFAMTDRDYKIIQLDLPFAF